MHTTSSPPGHRAPQTDAEIDAAVHAFVAALTGTHQPVDALVERYAHAMETIAEEVTEILATMANHR